MFRREVTPFIFCIWSGKTFVTWCYLLAGGGAVWATRGVNAAAAAACDGWHPGAGGGKQPGLTLRHHLQAQAGPNEGPAAQGSPLLQTWPSWAAYHKVTCLRNLFSARFMELITFLKHFVRFHIWIISNAKSRGNVWCWDFDLTQ